MPKADLTKLNFNFINEDTEKLIPVSEVPLINLKPIQQINKSDIINLKNKSSDLSANILQTNVNNNKSSEFLDDQNVKITKIDLNKTKMDNTINTSPFSSNAANLAIQNTFTIDMDDEKNEIQQTNQVQPNIFGNTSINSNTFIPLAQDISQQQRADQLPDIEMNLSKGINNPSLVSPLKTDITHIEDSEISNDIILKTIPVNQSILDNNIIADPNEVAISGSLLDDLKSISETKNIIPEFVNNDVQSLGQSIETPIKTEENGISSLDALNLSFSHLQQEVKETLPEIKPIETLKTDKPVIDNLLNFGTQIPITSNPIQTPQLQTPQLQTPQLQTQQFQTPQLHTTQ